MSTSLRLTLFGLLSYGLFLLLQLPASLLLESWRPPVGWRLDAPRGSVWDGEISQVSHQGRALGKLRWALSPWGLLLGELRADWAWDGPYGQARGEARYGLIGQQLIFHEVQTDLDMALASDFGWSPFPLQGRLKADLGRLDPAGKDYPQLTGQARWQQAGISVGETLSLGQVNIQAEPQKGYTRLLLSSVPSDVGVQGEIKLLAASRIDLALQLRPQSAHGRELLTLMQSVGKPLPDGGLAVRYRGTLP